jgi:aldehyde dehydrogenase (NAD+)
LKPSEETPYAGGLFFAEILEEAGVPNGVFNVITASRDRTPEVGDELIDNPMVKGISFTGSTPVGRRIAAKCGAHLKNAVLNLVAKIV